MEQNYNTDDFEHLLRETTDQFRMYPSRRVWHSIYNDLHPSKKWPSVAVLLLLVTSIMYIGVTNPNEPVITAQTSMEDRQQTYTASTPQQSAINDNLINRPHARDADQVSSNVNQAVIRNASNLSANISARAISNTAFNSNQNSVLNDNSISSTSTNPVVNTTSTISTTNNTVLSEEEANQIVIAGKDQVEISEPVVSIETPKTITNNLAALSSVSQEEKLREKTWMEDFAFHNKRKAGKFNGRLTHQVYVTPSVGYRTLRKNTEYSPPIASTLIANPAQSTTMVNTLNHSSAINLEAGSTFILQLSKKIRAKAGVQFNYTNYRINAYELNHPTFTTLMLNDLENGYPVLSARSTTVANTPSPYSENFNNNTYQISVPIGADYKIAGNNNLKWYAGATVQPTYIAGGHTYLISSDLKNYVTGENFMRKFNINGAFETFLSYKINNGVVLSAGPQVRYQFLSTYSKVYTYDEKLYNLGLKLGMTTNF